MVLWRPWWPQCCVVSCERGVAGRSEAPHVCTIHGGRTVTPTAPHLSRPGWRDAPISHIKVLLCAPPWLPTFEKNTLCAPLPRSTRLGRQSGRDAGMVPGRKGSQVHFFGALAGQTIAPVWHRLFDVKQTTVRRPLKAPHDCARELWPPGPRWAHPCRNKVTGWLGIIWTCSVEAYIPEARRPFGVLYEAADARQGRPPSRGNGKGNGKDRHQYMGEQARQDKKGSEISAPD
mmetsp:Transcript_17145/g.43966  ORF Transcript_17145/g.43966 Transcript_17145/m.43966 type:complete len:232 (+) Transcript_17145:640-1335(+)